MTSENFAEINKPIEIAQASVSVEEENRNFNLLDIVDTTTVTTSLGGITGAALGLYGGWSVGKDRLDLKISDDKNSADRFSRMVEKDYSVKQALSAEAVFNLNDYGPHTNLQEVSDLNKYTLVSKHSDRLDSIFGAEKAGELRSWLLESTVGGKHSGSYMLDLHEMMNYRDGDYRSVLGDKPRRLLPSGSFSEIANRTGLDIQKIQDLAKNMGVAERSIPYETFLKGTRTFPPGATTALVGIGAIGLAVTGYAIGKIFEKR